MNNEIQDIKQSILKLKEFIIELPFINVDEITMQLLQFHQEHELALMQNEDQGQEIINLQNQLQDLQERFREKMHNKTEQNEYLQEKRAELQLLVKTQHYTLTETLTEITELKQSILQIRSTVMIPFIPPTPPQQEAPSLKNKMFSQLAQIDMNEQLSTLQVRISELEQDKNDLIEQNLTLRKRAPKRQFDSVMESETTEVTLQNEIQFLKQTISKMQLKETTTTATQCNIQDDELASLQSSNAALSTQLKTMQASTLAFQQRSEMLQTQLLESQIDAPGPNLTTTTQLDLAAALLEKDLKISQLIENNQQINTDDVADELKAEIQRLQICEKRSSFMNQKLKSQIASQKLKIAQLEESLETGQLQQIKQKKLLFFVKNSFELETDNFEEWKTKINFKLQQILESENFTSLTASMNALELQNRAEIELLRQKLQVAENRGSALFRDNETIRKTMDFKAKNLQNLQNKLSLKEIDFDVLQQEFQRVSAQKSKSEQRQQTYDNIQEFYEEKINLLKSDVLSLHAKIKKMRNLRPKMQNQDFSQQTAKECKNVEKGEFLARKTPGMRVKMSGLVLQDEGVDADVRIQAGIEIWRFFVGQ